MKISLSELKAVILKEIDHLEKLGYAQVEYPVEYYWNIPQEVRYDPYQEPKRFTLGQLSDNWEGLKQVLEGEREPVVYDLVWLSTILRAIGEHALG
jgi:hypothetical protein